MKTEVGSFTPSASSTVTLDDDTFQVKGIFLEVSKNGSNVNLGSGFSDSIKNRAIFSLDDTIKDSGRSTTYCVLTKKNVSGVSTISNAGKVITNGFSVAGEFSMSFDNVDNSQTINFIVVGD